MRLGVVGGGACGVAAAWAARKRGAAVVLYHVAAGASELASGAADLVPWASSPTVHGRVPPLPSLEIAGEPSELTSDEVEFLRDLEHWQAGPACVVTTAGVIRPCLARDPALLDVTPLAGRRIAVARVERDDWDAPALARTLSDSPWAQRTNTRFEVASVHLLREGYERRIAPADLARLQDSAERRQQLAERLRELDARFDGVLMGPWLGIEADTVAELRRTVGRPLGECTSLPGGASGLRFAAARTRLLQKLGVDVLEERVVRARRRGPAWEITSEPIDEECPSGGARMETYDAVLLAVGGFVSGGLEFTPRQEAGSAFRLSLEAPVAFSITGEPLEQVSSTYGFDPTTAQGAWLEQAGILADAEGRLGPRGLAAAGDVVAGAPRTILQAVRGGIRAARSVT